MIIVHCLEIHCEMIYHFGVLLCLKLQDRVKQCFLQPRLGEGGIN